MFFYVGLCFGIHYFVSFLVLWVLFWYALLYVILVAFILTRKREMVTLLVLSFECLVTVNVL